jgi:hypothetical protein
LEGRPEGRSPLARPRHRWEDTITSGLEDVGRGGMDWIQLAQDRDRWRVECSKMNAVKNLRVP